MAAVTVERGGVPLGAAPSPGTLSPDGPERIPSASPALSLRRELARKAIHLSAGLVPIAYASGYPRADLLAWLGAMLAIAVAIEVGRGASPAVRSLFIRATGGLLRAHEHERPAGATWMLAALVGAVAFFPRDVATASMWAVAIGDALAAIVGRTIGSRREPGAKTVAGSVGCWLGTICGALWVAGLDFDTSLVAASVATLVERPRGPLDDNIRIVFATGIGILLWRMAFG